MEKLTFTNSRGVSITFDKKAPLLLQSIEGTGATEVVNQTQKAPFQDGETVIDTVLEPRPISIKVALVAKNESELSGLRSKLLSIFNPKLGEGVLTYDFAGNTKEIRAVVDQMPVFPSGKGSRGTNYQLSVFSLICFNPFWLDVSETKQSLTGWIGKFEFPLDFPVEFGERANRAIIINDGDESTPVLIEFYGQATNPIVTNETTGESIKVNRPLINGEVLEVNTAFGNKTVEIVSSDGTRTNVFHYIDPETQFFQLVTGENVISFTSDDSLVSGHVTVIYKKRYLGV